MIYWLEVLQAFCPIDSGIEFKNITGMKGTRKLFLTEKKKSPFGPLFSLFPQKMKSQKQKSKEP